MPRQLYDVLLYFYLPDEAECLPNAVAELVRPVMPVQFQLQRMVYQPIGNTEFIQLAEG